MVVLRRTARERHLVGLLLFWTSMEGNRIEVRRFELWCCAFYAGGQAQQGTSSSVNILLVSSISTETYPPLVASSDDPTSSSDTHSPAFFTFPRGGGTGHCFCLVCLCSL